MIMNILLKKVKIVYPGHPLHRKQVDILIKDGIIKKIGNAVRSQKSDIIEESNLHLSMGWLDINTFNGEPGYEHRETFESLAKSAHAGGYTAIGTAPNTLPVSDHKTAIHFQLKQANYLGLDIYPLGAVTSGCHGVDLAELMDMHHAGAAAFTDGFQSIQNGGVMMRALQYAKAFDGLIMNHPYDYTLSEEGMIHEGSVSTSLGMKGIPSLTEALMLQRDLDLLQYTDSRLHVLNISSYNSVELIREAKQKELKVSASVPVLNLIFTDEACAHFNYNFKVLPPLREEIDKISLHQALKSGIVDGINSNHVPIDAEHKKLEFAHADFGAIGLETTFSLLNTYYPKDLDLWIECLAIRNRRIIGLNPLKLEVGAKADFTLFDPKMKWTIQESSIKSRASNTPFLNTELTGKVIGIINGSFCYFS